MSKKPSPHGEMLIRPIARIKNGAKTKFALPRQSMLAPSFLSHIVFEPEFRIPQMLDSLEAYSHIWLIWGFSENTDRKFSPTVRPPRLGGNKRVGVLATRSPFRPNSLGLSLVKIEGISQTNELGAVICVSGADLMDETPIYDIKPYLSFTESIPDAKAGFAGEHKDYSLEVIFDPEAEKALPSRLMPVLEEILSGDPRPAYHNDPERIYGFEFEEYELKFKVNGGILTVISAQKMHPKSI